MMNSDLVSKDLMKQLSAAHKPFGAAYDVLWRRERMYRYVYWLEHAARPSFNLIGSWKQADIQVELELWKSFAVRGFNAEAAVEAGKTLFEERFGRALDEAIARAAEPALAARGLPIWNVATGSLVPQSLGPWRIYATEDNERQGAGLGNTYQYRQSGEDAPLTMYVYNQGEAGIEAGIGDPRLANALVRTLRDIEAAAQSRGDAIEMLMEPAVEVLRTPRGTEIQFVSSAWNVVTRDGERKTSAVSMTGFRGNILKIRLTGSETYLGSEGGRAAVTASNADVASFVEMFGP
jgi:hypothetical protein